MPDGPNSLRPHSGAGAYDEVGTGGAHRRSSAQDVETAPDRDRGRPPGCGRRPRPATRAPRRHQAVRPPTVGWPDPPAIAFIRLPLPTNPLSPRRVEPNLGPRLEHGVRS